MKVHALLIYVSTCLNAEACRCFSPPTQPRYEASSICIPYSRIVKQMFAIKLRFACGHHITLNKAHNVPCSQGHFAVRCSLPCRGDISVCT